MRDFCAPKSFTVLVGTAPPHTNHFTHCRSVVFLHLLLGQRWGYILARVDLGIDKGGCSSERATDEAKPRHGRRRCVPAVIWGFPRKYEKLDSQMHLPGISGHYKVYDWLVVLL